MEKIGITVDQLVSALETEFTLLIESLGDNSKRKLYGYKFSNDDFREGYDYYLVNLCTKDQRVDYDSVSYWYLGNKLESVQSFAGAYMCTWSKEGTEMYVDMQPTSNNCKISVVMALPT